MLAFISAVVVVVCVCIGVVMNLTTLYDENFDHMGLRTFCMFTVNSNILTGIGMFLTIPYAIEELRKRSYVVPGWLVELNFILVTSIAITFLVSLFILSPVKGFVLIFTGSRFFLHGLCPILAIAAFCFFMSEKQLRLKDSLIVLLPVLIYSVLYYVMVVVVGEEKGGWSDFYGFLTRLPMWIPLTAILPLTFLIATGIRVLHNRSFDRREQEEAAAFTELFADADVPKLVAAMARSHSSAKILDIVIPTRIISIMLEHNKGGHSLEECCEIYLREYFETSDVIKMEELWI